MPSKPRRPYSLQAPADIITNAGLFGGGLVPLPGEISLAHHSVLLLDELPELRRHVLEVLHQPLEESVNKNTIARAFSTSMASQR
jgi:magnesium chelatase family protein